MVQPTQGGAPGVVRAGQVRCADPRADRRAGRRAGRHHPGDVPVLRARRRTCRSWSCSTSSTRSTGVASKALISEKEVHRPGRRAGRRRVRRGRHGRRGGGDRRRAARCVITAGTDDPAYPGHRRRRASRCWPNAEWLEIDPLGRAEWVKYFAALTGTEEQAAEFFDGVRADYAGARAVRSPTSIPCRSCRASRTRAPGSCRAASPTTRG